MSFHVPQDKPAGAITLTAGRSSGGTTLTVSGWPSGWTSFPMILCALRNAGTSSEVLLTILEVTAQSGGSVTTTGPYSGDGMSDSALLTGDTLECRPTKGMVIELQTAISALQTTVTGLGTAAFTAASAYDAAGLAAEAQTAAQSFATSAISTNLAAYTGTTNLVTLGTVTTGAWTATPIADAYIASAATWNAKQAAGSYLTALTGDVTASGPGSAAATVVALQGHAVAATAPTDTWVLTWDATAGHWVAKAATGGGGSPGGSSGQLQYNNSGVFAGSANQFLDGSGFLRMTRTFISFDLSTSYQIILDPYFPAVIFQSNGQVAWSSGNADTGAVNCGVSRAANAIVKITDGSTGLGSLLVGTASTTQTPMAVRGIASQTAPLHALQQISSTSTARDVAYNDAGFTVATDASYVGYGRLAAQDWNATAGGVECFRYTTDGSTNPKLGFYGATPVVKASTPTTLANVITILQNLGLCS